LVGAGSKTPEKLITDDELISLLKKCADDRFDDGKKTLVTTTTAANGLTFSLPVSISDVV